MTDDEIVTRVTRRLRRLLSKRHVSPAHRELAKQYCGKVRMCRAVAIMRAPGAYRVLD